MTYSDICEAVAKLKVKYDETDPFRLCHGNNTSAPTYGEPCDSNKGVLHGVQAN